MDPKCLKNKRENKTEKEEKEERKLNFLVGFPITLERKVAGVMIIIN